MSEEGTEEEGWFGGWLDVSSEGNTVRMKYPSRRVRQIYNSGAQEVEGRDTDPRSSKCLAESTHDSVI